MLPFTVQVHILSVESKIQEDTYGFTIELNLKTDRKMSGPFARQLLREKDIVFEIKKEFKELIATIYKTKVASIIALCKSDELNSSIYVNRISGNTLKLNLDFSLSAKSKAWIALSCFTVSDILLRVDQIKEINV